MPFIALSIFATPDATFIERVPSRQTNLRNLPEQRRRTAMMALAVAWDRNL